MSYYIFHCHQVVHLQIQTLSFECDSELLIITNSHKSTHRSKTLSRYGRVTISQRTVVINVQCPALDQELYSTDFLNNIYTAGSKLSDFFIPFKILQYFYKFNFFHLDTSLT